MFAQQPARHACTLLVVICAMAAGACGDDAGDSASTSATTPAVDTSAFPLTITNCGQKQTFDKPPSRVASMDLIASEFLLHLGLEDSMVGTASKSADVFDGGGGFESIVASYESVPKLADKYPSQEVLINATPDLVVGNSDAYTFGPTTNGGTGFTRADMSAQDIGTYTFLCKDEEAKNDLLFTRYEELGEIMGKADEAKALIAKVRGSLAATADVLAGSKPVKTFYYESGTGPLKTYGGGGQFDNGLKDSGGTNVFASEPSFPTPTVTAEKVISANPDAIVVVDAGAFGPNDPSADGKKKFLVSTLGQSVNAVKKDRFCYLGFYDMTIGPRLAATQAALAACLHPELKFG